MEKELTTVDRYKHLGVTVLAGKSFTVSESPFLRKLRCPMNTLLNVQQLSSEQMLMTLLYTVCVPNLTYACDGISYNVRQINAMTVTLNDSIQHIFSYNRWESVTYKIHLAILSLLKSFKVVTEFFKYAYQVLETELYVT